MKKDNNNYGLYLTAIVAIVAIVGLVFMFGGGSAKVVKQAPAKIAEQANNNGNSGNVAGHALETAGCNPPCPEGQTCVFVPPHKAFGVKGGYTCAMDLTSQ